MYMENLMKFILGLEKGQNRKSSFIMALKSARYCMGRDIETGKSFDDEAGGIPAVYAMRDVIVDNWMFDEARFMGMTMYLILLDQMGCVFALKDKIADRNESGVKYALECFSNMSKDECDAIYALRCTLAHNFGLATETRRGKAYKFILSFDVNSPFVSLPAKEWNRDYSDKSDETSTTIGIYALCNEIESVVNKIYDAYERGNLKFKADDINEVTSRFTLIV